MPPWRWADLPPELLCRIGDGLDLKFYGSARGVCTAWRCALAPPSPSILVVPDGARCCLSAASLPTRHSFKLKRIPPGTRCAGSSNGWLALSSCLYGGQSTFSLFNTITATEIVLPPVIYEFRLACISKLLFAPSPASNDFIAPAICDVDRLAYVTAGARRWTVLDPVRLARGDELADVVYHVKKGKRRVYCLTCHGDAHVLRLPERHRRKPVMVDNPSSGLLATAEQHHDMIRTRSLGPDLNAPATEHLMSILFDLATSFMPPFNTVSVYASAKILMFCEGHLYQIWRNTGYAVLVRLPEGGRRRVAENEVLVLWYYPRRRPCWKAVADLGGYSVFLGRNNAVSVYAQGGAFPGLKGDSVYWIGGRGRDQGMVFAMATGRTTACLLPHPPAAAGHSTISWYFPNDNYSNNNGGRRAYQTRAKVYADGEKQKIWKCDASSNCSTSCVDATCHVHGA